MKSKGRDDFAIRLKICFQTAFFEIAVRSSLPYRRFKLPNYLKACHTTQAMIVQANTIPAANIITNTSQTAISILRPVNTRRTFRRPPCRYARRRTEMRFLP